MKSFLKAVPALVLLLLAAYTFAAIVKAHDPVALLGWIFGLAVILTAGNPVPSADPQTR
jgi:hypothetical protein